MADSGDVVCGAEVMLHAKIISNDLTSILMDFLNYNANAIGHQKKWKSRSFAEINDS
jgi:hypothetical protein